MIRVTFPDGTTEERPATSPALLNPVDPLDIHSRGPRKVAPSDLGFLRDFTRSGNVYVWCLTGDNGALTGEWRQCHAETSAEQIERLTRERDVAVVIAAIVANLVERYETEPDFSSSDGFDCLRQSPAVEAWRREHR